MPTATTTAQLVREDRRNIVESLNPGQISKVKFREYDKGGDFRTWAEEKPASCFRRFQVVDLATYEVPLISDMVLEQVITQFEVTVAYPADGRYGGDQVNGLEDAIRADQVRIETRIGALSYGNYPSGLDLFQLSSYEIEKGEDVYFLVAVYDANFKRAVDLGLTNLVGSLSMSGTLSAAIVQTHVTTGSLTATATLSGNATRVQPLAGSLTATGTLSGNINELGPTLLADFNYTEPATVGVDGSGSFTSTYATDEWEDFSTGTVPNAASGGTETLANTGGLTNRNTVSLWNGTDFTTRVGWEATGTNQTLDASGTTAGDSNNADFAFRIVFRLPSAHVNDDFLLAKRGTTGAGWYLTTSGGFLKLIINDGTNTIILAGNQELEDGAWHVVEGWFDQSTLTAYQKSDKQSEVSGTNGSLLTLTNAKSLSVCANGDGANDWATGAQIAYVGVSVGANAQNFYDESVVLPGADPGTQDAAKTALTTISRASLISVQTSATTIGHYSDDQLPVGYNSNFSDTNKLGLYANSAVTNFITDSEDLSGAAWSNVNASDAQNIGDAPDGFRSASSITATAANGFMGHGSMVITAQTDYTSSVWVKRNGGSNVAGALRIYDVVDKSYVGTQTFTATDTWQMVTVTAQTLAAPNITMQTIIRVDTNTESILAWGVQHNLGDARGAYIRTSGASAALVLGDYQADSAAGALAKAASGEYEVNFVTAFPNSQAGSGYIFDLSNDSNNFNRVALFNDSNGRRPRPYAYDSAGAFVWGLNPAVSATDLSTQENTIVTQWDETGGLAVGGGADASATYNGGSAVNDIGSYTTADTIDNIQIGNYRSASNSFAPDAFIQRIRIWDGER